MQAEVVAALITNLDSERLGRLKAEWLAHAGGSVRCADFVWLLSRNCTLGADAGRFSEEQTLRGMMECWADLDAAADGSVSWDTFSAFLSATFTSLTQSVKANEAWQVYRPCGEVDVGRSYKSAADALFWQPRKMGQAEVQVSIIKQVYLDAPLDKLLLCERHGTEVHLRLYQRTPAGVAFARELQGPPFVLTDATYMAEHELLAGSFVGTWVQLWSTPGYAPLRRVGGQLRAPIISLAWAGRASALVGGTASGSLALLAPERDWAAREGAPSADKAPITALLHVGMPESELIVSGSLSGEICVCALAAGALQPLWRLRGHTGGISALAYAPAQHLLLSAGLDRLVCAFNLLLPSGAAVARIEVRCGPLLQLVLPIAAARGHGHHVALAGDAQGHMRVISLRSLRVVQAFHVLGHDEEGTNGKAAAHAPAAPADALAKAAAGTVAAPSAAAASGGRQRAERASLFSTFTDPRDSDRALIVGFCLEGAHSDRLIAAPAKGSVLRLFAAVGLCARPTEGARRLPRALAAGGAAADGAHAPRTTSRSSAAVSTTSVDGFSERRSIFALALLGDGATLASATASGVRTWDAATGRPLRSYRSLSPFELTAFCADKTGRRFFVGDHSGRLREFSFLSGALLREARPHGSEVVAILLAQRLHAILTASWDGSVLLTHNAAAGQQLRTDLGTRLTGPDGTASSTELTCLALAHAEDWLAAGTAAGSLIVWQPAHARREAVCTGPHAGAEVTAVAFARRAQLLLATDSKGGVCGWALPPAPDKFCARFHCTHASAPQPALVPPAAHATAGVRTGRRGSLALQCATWDEAASLLYAADDSGAVVGWQLELGVGAIGVGATAVLCYRAHEESVSALALARVPVTPPASVAADADAAAPAAAAGVETGEAQGRHAPAEACVLLSASTAGVVRLWAARGGQLHARPGSGAQSAGAPQPAHQAGTAEPPPAGAAAADAVAPRLLGWLSLTLAELGEAASGPSPAARAAAESAGAAGSSPAWELCLDRAALDVKQLDAMRQLIEQLAAGGRERRERRHTALNRQLLLPALWGAQPSASAALRAQRAGGLAAHSAGGSDGGHDQSLGLGSASHLLQQLELGRRTAVQVGAQRPSSGSRGSEGSSEDEAEQVKAEAILARLGHPAAVRGDGQRQQRLASAAVSVKS